VDAGRGNARAAVGKPGPGYGNRPFLKKPILSIRISDRTLASLWAGEDRYLNPAVIIDPLNPAILPSKADPGR
jgi:hypothetical protein